MKPFGDTTGAFADGAVLFPLLAALTVTTGMDGTVLLASAGAAYLAAGLVFRVPMPVQPLKALAVAALALGASPTEVAVSGGCVGLSCLALSRSNLDALSVPRHLVHGLQIALGILLMGRGAELLAGSPVVSPLLGSAGAGLGSAGVTAAVLAVLAALLVGARHLRQPWLGFVAVAALGVGLLDALSGRLPASLPLAAPVGPIRPEVILALTLPQLALTLTNSVLATEDAAQRYFGADAARVTRRRLLLSIGVGNLIAAPLGGLPFCHGSGGLTAHVEGGARSWHMNLIIGGVLVALAALSVLLAFPLIPALPREPMALLLFATGALHLRLAAPSWRQPELRWHLWAMAGTALFTQNLLWALCCGLGCEAWRRWAPRQAA